MFIAPGDFRALLALTVAQGFAQGSGNLMLRAIVSDLADDHRLKTGKEQSGLLFSIFNVTNNAAAAAAVGLAYPLIGWFRLRAWTLPIRTLRCRPSPSCSRSGRPSAICSRPP